jgi:AraC-like DNA-binding protein
MDALSEVMRLVRLTGAVFLNAEMTAPWAIRTPSSRQIADVLMPEADHLIEYHLVVEGACWIRVGDDPPIELRPGDLVMVPHGDRHVMSSDAVPRSAPADATGLRLPPLGQVAMPRYGGGGAMTRIVCGFLAIDRRLCESLLNALPPVLHVCSAGSELGQWLQAFVRIRLVERAEEQPGGASVLAKLSELMFVEAIRRYVDALPQGQAGWLAGLRDPYVGKALGLLHSQPARPWTVDSLAREVGLSRSGLADRFTALIGRSPIQYLTHWRLTLAAHALQTTTRPASAIAYDVGYESEAAFNRAFRREYGAPPAAWRRESPATRRTEPPSRQATKAPSLLRIPHLQL